MKTRQERAALRKTLDRQVAQTFADAYFSLEHRNCSAFEWFVLKSSGDMRAARRRWNALDMDDVLRRWSATNEGRAALKTADAKTSGGNPSAVDGEIDTFANVDLSDRPDVDNPQEG